MNMANTRQHNTARMLTHFLKRINHGEDPILLRKEANKILTTISPQDVVIAEQNLINDGYSTQIVQLLSATFMLMGIAEKQDDLKTSLPNDHILRLVMVEHDLIRCFLADLEEVTKVIVDLKYFTDVSLEFRKLAHIAQHLKAMRHHIERENDVIFPYLEKYGHISLCQVAQNDHTNIQAQMGDLFNLITSFNQIDLEEFKAYLATISGNLISITLEHLSQEDILLYPIAIGMISDATIWKKIKDICDEIGYCGVHL
jgi:uncharacterized protein